MPGLLGFTKINSNLVSPQETMKRMQKEISYRPFHINDKVFEDVSLISSRVYLPVIQKDAQPFSNDGIFIWLDGEFYNQDHFTKDSFSDSCLLLSYYKNNRLNQFLREVDGIFAAVIYDSNKKTVQLISDRYGLRHLYFSFNKNNLVWSSEIKAFALIPYVDISVNQESVNDFFISGYLLENKTWLNGVELLEPATVMTFDLNNSKLSSSVYWSWDEFSITEIDDFDEVAEELGKRFIEAVDKRCNPGEKIGLGLSGGLDSRAIFAALPERISSVPLVTFGKAGCGDIIIAQRVAKLRSSTHHILQINQHNWLDNRCEGIWWLDAQINMLHTHGIEQIDLIRTWYDIELNGFLGGAHLGGVYCSDKINEYELFKNRGRRFIAAGLTLSNIFYHTRIPFFDNQLMELIMSIPARFRKDAFIYSKMLISAFPQYYESIPWQSTSLPISFTGLHWNLFRKFHKYLRALIRRIPWMVDSESYTNYPEWIRNGKARELFDNIVINKDALINNYVDPLRIKKDVQSHMSGKNKSEVLGLYLTFEIWLQQFFNKRFRDGF